MRNFLILSAVLLTACGKSDVKKSEMATANFNIAIDTLNLANSRVIEVSKETQDSLNKVVETTIPEVKLEAAREKAKVILDSILKTQADTIK